MFISTLGSIDGPNNQPKTSCIQIVAKISCSVMEFEITYLKGDTPVNPWQLGGSVVILNVFFGCDIDTCLRYVLIRNTHRCFFYWKIINILLLPTAQEISTRWEPFQITLLILLVSLMPLASTPVNEHIVANNISEHCYANNCNPETSAMCMHCYYYYY